MHEYMQMYAYMWTWQDTASRCMGPCLESIAFVFDELLTSMCAKVFVSRRWPTGASQGVSPTTTTAETTFLSSREQRFSCTPEKHDPLFNSAEHLKMENHSICGIGYARHW